MLDTSKPTDQVMVSELPAYIRADRMTINALEAENNVTTTNLSVSTGQTSLVVGVGLSDALIETVFISGIGAAVIDQIRGGIDGQVKIFIFQSSVVGFKDGPKTLGQIYLNQLPVLSTFSAQQDDVLVLVNKGGNGSTEYGYWKEIWRQLSVK